MSVLIPMLVAETGLRERDVRLIILTAPSRYKTYSIDKRAGGKRVISQPARELKILQRVLLAEVLEKLPIHEAATAYRAGYSIKPNAEPHAKNGPILKMDFKDFFPSLKAPDWSAYCELNKIFSDDEDVQISTNILFHRPKGTTVLRLAIGAPTSPCLSNILLYPFDEKISLSLGSDKIRYTRYADDLTFSAPRTGYLNPVESMVRRVLRQLDTPSLSINKKKL